MSGRTTQSGPSKAKSGKAKPGKAKPGKAKPGKAKPTKKTKPPKPSNEAAGGRPEGAKPARPDAPKGPRVPTVTRAEFVAGLATPTGTLPPPTCIEIAFAGRSNVGKSSLINTLLNRKGLVRTSSTPGCTRQVNLFEIELDDGSVMRFADLPGYGFAKRSKVERKAWQSLIEGYLLERATLTLVVLLVDVRRGVEPDDQALIDFIAATDHPNRRPVELLLAATKLDKVGRSQQRAMVSKLQQGAGRRAIGFSAHEKAGVAELWAALRRATSLLPDLEAAPSPPELPETGDEARRGTSSPAANG